MVERIISGGQTGADEGGLEAAQALGIATGGTMPYGFLTEEGVREDLAERFGLVECQEPGYGARTDLNVRDSDGTIRFAKNFGSPGERRTLNAIQSLGKPYIDVDVKRPRPHRDVSDWFIRNCIRVLNVAGNRESTAAGIGAFTKEYLTVVLSGGTVMKAREERTPVPLYKATKKSTRKAPRNGPVSPKVIAVTTKDHGPLTWAEFKQMVERSGVTDDSQVFMIDIGPNATEVHVSIDGYGQVEIGDDPCLLINIGD